MTFNIITGDSQIIEQPNSISIPLRRHQLATIYSAKQLEESYIMLDNNNRIKLSYGCMMDPSYSGKSLSIIGLCNTPTQRDANCIVNEYNIYRKVEQLTLLRMNVIVTHPLNIDSWRHNLKYTNLQYTVIDNYKTNNDLIHSFINNRITDMDICVFTDKLFMNFTNKINLQTVSFSRIIFDNVHTINLKDIPQLHTGFTWFVTPYIPFIEHNTSNKHFYTNILNNIYTEYYFFNIHKYVFNNMIIKTHIPYLLNSLNITQKPMIKVIDSYGDNIQYILDTIIENNKDIQSSHILKYSDIKNIVKNDEQLCDIIDTHFNKKYIKIQQDINKQLNSDCSINIDKLIEDKDRLTLNIDNIKKRIHEKIQCDICENSLGDLKAIIVCQCFYIGCVVCIHKTINISHKCPICKDTVTKENIIIHNYNNISTQTTQVSKYNTKQENLKLLYNQYKQPQMHITQLSHDNESFSNVKTYNNNLLKRIEKGNVTILNLPYMYRQNPFHCEGLDITLFKTVIVTEFKDISIIENLIFSILLNLQSKIESIIFLPNNNDMKFIKSSNLITSLLYE